MKEVGEATTVAEGETNQVRRQIKLIFQSSESADCFGYGFFLDNGKFEMDGNDFSPESRPRTLTELNLVRPLLQLTRFSRLTLSFSDFSKFTSPESNLNQRRIDA